MRVRRVQESHELSSLAGEWDRLAEGHPLRSFAWHSNWWKHYGNDRELYVLEVRDNDDEVVGIVPWCLQQRGGQGNVLAWLGSGDVCSDYQTILVADQHADAVADALADWLEGSAGGEHAWDLIHLDAVATHDTVVTKLLAQLWSGGQKVHREEGPNCWRIALPASWEEYVSSLSKSHRKQVRRVERRQLDTGRATFHVVENEGQLAQGLDILVELHQKRRKSLGEPGCFACDAFKGFIFDTAKDFLASGQLRISWIEVEGQPAAVEFQVADEKVTYAYQAGVAPDLLDDEPGRIINIATIRHAIEQGQQSFDFLRGDEPYKAHWRAEPHATTTYRVVPKKTSSQVRHGLWLAGDNVKQWVKSGLELTGMR